MIPQVFDFPRTSFNKRLLIETSPVNLSSDAGAVAVRELAERLGILDWMDRRLDDVRSQPHVTHKLRELLATVLVMLAQGYRDRDDADKLRNDPAMRLAVSTRTGDAALLKPATELQGKRGATAAQTPDGLGSQPTLSRLVTMLSSETNRAFLDYSLVVAAGHRIRAANRGHRLRNVTVDIDSLPVEVHGEQPGSAFHGHYHSTIYHVLVASLASEGDIVGVMLRSGCAASADDSLPFILQVVKRLQAEVALDVDVRFDAAFPQEERLATLEKRKLQYVGRVGNNAVLDRMAEPRLAQHAQHTATGDGLWAYEYMYAAESWSRRRRVVLVIQERAGDLFPNHFWLVTNYSQLRKSGMALLQHYRKRGSAEAAMGEWMSCFEPALSSAPRPKSHYRHKAIAARRAKDPEGPAEGKGDTGSEVTAARRAEDPEGLGPAEGKGDTGSEVASEESLDDRLEAERRAFATNEAWLMLTALAYNLVHALRTLVQDGTHEGWSVCRIREQVLKVGARFTRSSRYVTMAIPDASGRIWEVLWYKLAHLRVAPLAFCSS